MVLVGSLLGAGCGQNAILALTIELPEGISGADARFLSDPDEFDDPEWMLMDAEALDEVGGVAEVDVVATGASIDAPLGMRLAICDATPCPSDAPEVRILFERPFYLGQRTFHTLVVPFTPTQTEGSEMVGRCELGGCLEGETDSYCRLDGRHYCA